ncbi:MAG: hypothetical protein ACKV0T_30045 [Planctomycetales bacterium]
MPRLFYSNFDFEHELAATAQGDGGRSKVARGLQSGLGTAWLALAEENDVILTPEPIDPADFSGLARLGVPLPRFATHPSQINEGGPFELVPWGWTPTTAALAVEWGCRRRDLPLEVVRHVNRRQFRLELERRLGVALPGEEIADSFRELQRIVAAGRSPRGWILKADFGMAGRESIRGRGNSIPETIRNWAQSRIQQSGCVIFEPLVEPLAEAGIQIEIPASAPPSFLGLALQIVDQNGAYRGSRLAAAHPQSPRELPEERSWQTAIDVALQAASELQQCGYIGPLGIDGMWYRAADGQPALRPLQDLNARYTMGRLALGFQRLVPSGWCASWLHVSPRIMAAQQRASRSTPADDSGSESFAASFRDQLAAVASASPEGLQIVPTSPVPATDQATIQSALIIARSPAIRATAEMRLLGSVRPDCG